MSAQAQLAKKKQAAAVVPAPSSTLLTNVSANVSRDPPRLSLPASYQAQVQDRGIFGMDYDEDAALLIMRTEATIARRKAETPKQYMDKLRGELSRIERGIDSSEESESEAEFVCTPMKFNAPVELDAPVDFFPLTQVGACETMFMHSKKSQPHLIAMCQGLVTRSQDPYTTTYLFDLEVDELLKNCPQKAQLLPQVKHLKEEATRRSSVMKIKPLKKSATKAELIEWLKNHPVNDSMDEAFLYFEGNKTYGMLMQQADDAVLAEAERRSTSNWNSPFPWMRLYHCSLDDDVLELLKTSSDCMTRPELDARNSQERPPLYWQTIADKYNSDEIYDSYALPEIHSRFAESIELKFSDMPGGAMTADDVKWRLGEARAKMIAVSSTSKDSCMLLSCAVFLVPCLLLTPLPLYFFLACVDHQGLRD
jgi:hypothetical protein